MIGMINTTWQHLIGHEWAAALLSSAITHERVGHAYLITGPAQVGKTTLARTFAQALNCQAPAGQPCGQCRACRLIAQDRHPDVRLVLPERTGRGLASLKIDQIRALQHELNLAPYEARWRVAILREFDAANASAANAFLKTLEEPPANVVLLLTANDADTLLPTISSRCQTIALRPLPAGQIAAALQNRWHLPPPQAELLAHLADGRPGWGIQAAGDESLLAMRRARLDTLYALLPEKRVGRFAAADRLAKEPETLPLLLQTWLGWWRDLVLLCWGNSPTARLTNVDQLPHLQAVAGQWTRAQAHAGLDYTGRALEQLARNANTRLVLENLFLNYPYQQR